MTEPDITASRVGTPAATVPIELFTVWKEYEQVAMHFNDLIIRLRSQSLGGVAALAAIAGVIARGDVPQQLRREILAGVFTLLSVFWVAIWILDFTYYNRLLVGAVRALLEIEEFSKSTGASLPLNLSTRIEEAVRGPQPAGKNEGSAVRPPHEARQLAGAKGRRWFYGLVMAGLLGGVTVSVIHARQRDDHHAAADSGSRSISIFSAAPSHCK
jgi:hypothetical protein